MAALSFGTPGATDFKSKLASMLAQGALDSSPIQSPWQGASRLAQALLTGLEIRDQDAKDKQFASALTNLPGLNGSDGTAAAPAVPATPATTSTPVASGDMSQPRGIRNNNPLNIEAGGFTQSQPGFAGSDGRFAKFSTPDQGAAAASNLLDVYANKHGLNTVAGIIGRWAPTSDGNNVSAYAANVSHQLGVDPNAPLDMANPSVKQQLIAAMAQHENGRPVQIASLDPNAGVAASAQPQAAPSQLAQALAGPAPAQQPTQMAQAAQPAQPVAPPAQGRPTVSIPPQIATQIKGYLGSSDPRMRQLGMQLYQQYGTPVENKMLQTPDGTVLSVNPRTNAVAPIYKAGDKPTSLMQNLESAGLKPGTPEYQKAVLDASKTTTTINNTVNPVLKGVGDRFNEDMDTARASIPQIQGIFEARKALDQGAITGAGADPKLFAAKAASLFGLGGDAAVNTEVLRSSIGNSVLAKAKTLGANPSNADREYIEKIMGGSIQLEEGSMRKLLDIQEKWARGAIDRANKQGQALLSAQPDELKNIGGLLQVQQPQTYDEFLKANPITAPQTQAAPAAPDRSAIENEMRRRGLLK